MFGQLGESPPAARRRELSATFLEMANRQVPGPWQERWRDWFSHLGELALRGGSIQPFRRDDPEGNTTLADTLAGVLQWQEPALVRYASAAICGDSKQLQSLEPRLRVALEAITGSSAFEDFGILRKPRSVTFHGPLFLTLGGQTVDLSIFPGPVTLAETNFPPETHIHTPAPLCLTVENEDTFHELAATNPGVLLILTSYAGSAVRRMIRLLPSSLPCHHFGDSDPAGSDILRDLREKAGRDIQPLLIGRPTPGSARIRALSETDTRILKRLLDSDMPEALRPHLEQLLKTGKPGDFEQESIPVAEVWSALGFHDPPSPHERP